LEVPLHNNLSKLNSVSHFSLPLTGHILSVWHGIPSEPVTLEPTRLHSTTLLQGKYFSASTLPFCWFYSTLSLFQPAWQLCVEAQAGFSGLFFIFSSNLCLPDPGQVGALANALTIFIHWSPLFRSLFRFLLLTNSPIRLSSTPPEHYLRFRPLAHE
jgi:hypothetical protein